MNDSNNPLSPHLQIYRWHISSLLSITHRIAGIINLFALILIFFWLLVLSFGESNYESFLLIINSFFGKFILIGFTWSMSFHLLSGIRHLAWDFGYGFEIKTANISGVIVVISSLVSITHRISGVINLIALILIFFWLLALNLGESNYELFLSIINSFFGKFILIGFTWSMSFHILSGIRHLVFDLGYGYEIKIANISGLIVIISSLFFTIIFWLLARGLI